MAKNQADENKRVNNVVSLADHFAQGSNIGKAAFFGAYVQPDERWYRSCLSFRAAWKGKGDQLQVCTGILSFDPMNISTLAWEEMTQREWKWELKGYNEKPINCEELAYAIKSWLEYWQIIDGKAADLAEISERLWPDLGKLINDLAPLPALSAERSRQLMHKLRPKKMTPEDTIFAFVAARQHIDFELEQALWAEGPKLFNESWWENLERYIFELKLENEDLNEESADSPAPWHIYARILSKLNRRSQPIFLSEFEEELSDEEDGQLEELMENFMEEVVAATRIVPYTSESVDIHPVPEDELSLQNPQKQGESRRYHVKLLQTSSVNEPVILEVLGSPLREKKFELTLRQIDGHWWLTSVNESEPARFLSQEEKVNRFRHAFFFSCYSLGSNVQSVTGRLDGSNGLDFLPGDAYLNWVEGLASWKGQLDEGHNNRCNIYLVGQDLVIVAKDEGKVAEWEKRLFPRQVPQSWRGSLPMWLFQAFQERFNYFEAESFSEWSRELSRDLALLNPERVGIPEEWQIDTDLIDLHKFYWPLVEGAWIDWLQSEKHAEQEKVFALLGEQIGVSPALFMKHGEPARRLLRECLALALHSEYQPVGLRTELDILNPQLVQTLTQWAAQPFGLYQVADWRFDGRCKLVDVLRQQELSLRLNSDFSPLEKGLVFFGRLLPEGGDNYGLIGFLEIEVKKLPALMDYLQQWKADREMAWDEMLSAAGLRLLGEVLAVISLLAATKSKAAQMETGHAKKIAKKPPTTSDKRKGIIDVYRFRVKLKGLRGVWRDVEVRSDQTLDHLHEIIQEAFDWADDHLYAFYLNNKLWDPTQEYGGPETDSERKAARAKLKNLCLELKQKFAYLFNFGDCHVFEVQVRDILPAEQGVKFPRIVAEKGEAPPQYGDFEDDDWNN